MGNQTWTVKIVISRASDAVYAAAALVDGPVVVTGQGRAVSSGDSGSSERDDAVAARRALTELLQSMRYALEQNPARHAEPTPGSADRRAG